ncbi:MAG: hypothetical protein R2873_22465 [Caldilineaceae bacterium]
MTLDSPALLVQNEGTEQFDLFISNDDSVGHCYEFVFHAPQEWQVTRVGPSACLPAEQADIDAHRRAHGIDRQRVPRNPSGTSRSSPSPSTKRNKA